MKEKFDYSKVKAVTYNKEVFNEDFCKNVIKIFIDENLGYGLIGERLNVNQRLVRKIIERNNLNKPTDKIFDHYSEVHETYLLHAGKSSDYISWQVMKKLPQFETIGKVKFLIDAITMYSKIGEKAIEEMIYDCEYLKMNTKKLSEKYNIHDRIISHIFNIYQYVNNRKILKSISYKHDNANIGIFRNIDTHEKEYWLGFIYADGHVSKFKCCHCFS